MLYIICDARDITCTQTITNMVVVDAYLRTDIMDLRISHTMELKPQIFYCECLGVTLNAKVFSF